MRFLLIAFYLLIWSTTTAKASEDYGLAMVGTPKYSAQDSHLSYANPDAPKGGTLKQSATGSFDTLNPYTIKGRAAAGLNLVTDRLMARVWDEPFTMYPLIAEKVDVPEDRSAITFTLNPKARFHDGSPITTDDVLFSFDTLREYGRPNMRRIYKLATANKIDKHKIEFKLSGDYDRETVMILAMMPVLSKAYWEEREFDTTTLEPPLGSGPYKIKSLEAGKHIVFERVKDYWAADLLTNKGHHNFDEIIYEYYRDDTVAFESFKAGDLNLRREWDAGDWNSAYDFPALEKGDVIKEELKHGRPDKVRGFIFNTRRAPFDDIRVREALGLLFDFDWVNKNLFHGQYKRINSFYPNTDLAREVKEDTKPQNPRANMRRANELLEEAGWSVKDGKRVHTQSAEPMSFDILTDDPGQEKIALALVRPLKKMGIEARVRVLDSAAYRGHLNDYDFDMILHYWHSTLSPGTEQYLYWSCEAASQPSRWNYAGICDPEIDELAKSIPEAKTRAELAQKTQSLDSKLWEARLFIPLYYNPLDFVSYWKPLKRPETTPLYGMVVETWWIEEDQPP
ncbi:MAG: extracellular solute-binding protein [Alphaproteobacteria bacterium]|nr:extracellular solute-binding protein [Alphaproteobacteria bacterium]